MVLEGSLPSGRERAIETLIDMEPQGAFYRAARILDEVVPQALLNRPNVVTKAALVEQANSLAEHAIDDLVNYDSVFGSEPAGNSSGRANATAAGSSGGNSSTPLLSASSLSTGNNNNTSTSHQQQSKERLLKHHAKQCTVLQKQQQPAATAGGTTTNSSTTTPSPQLVAVLRQIYGTTTNNNTTNTAAAAGNDDDPSSANALSFPALLKAIMDHKVFEAPNAKTATATKAVTATDSTDPEAAATADATATDATKSGGGGGGEAGATLTPSSATNSTSTSNQPGGNAPVALVESLIANVCRQVVVMADDTAQGSTSEEKKAQQQPSHGNNNILQGLLVAALSVVTHAKANSANSESDANNKPGNSNSKGNDVVAANNNNNKGNSSNNKKSFAEDPSASPALRVGSIMSLLKLEDTTNILAGDGYHLDKDLIDYFSQAAIADESRLEIKKERILVKLQLDVAAAASFQHALAAASAAAAETATTDPVPGTPGANTTTAASSNRERSTSVIPVALTPTESRRSAPTPTTNGASTATGDVLEGDATAAATGGDHLERLEEATLASAAALEQIISSATATTATATGGEGEDGDPSSGSGSDSDSDLDAAAAAAVIAAAAASGENNQSTSAADEDEAHDSGSPATDDDDDDDDNDVDAGEEDDDDSSSSSSADDWAMMQEQAARNSANREDGDDEEDDDEDGQDDEEDALQQALALSLSEHTGNNTSTDADAAAATEQNDDQTQSGSTLHASRGEGASGDGREINKSQPLLEIPTKSESDCDDDDDEEGASSLPPLPAVPKAHSYARLLGHPLELDSEQTDAMESVFAPYFDPDVLTKFGSIPTANVLVHLLRYTTGIIEQSRFQGATPAKDRRTVSASKMSSVPGGMGTSLFPPTGQCANSTFDIGVGDTATNSGIPVTLQLLVAFFLQIMDMRDEAVSGLRKSLAQEVRHAQGEDVAQESITSGGVSSPLSSEEEDDPAIALAMNYAEDSVAESADSLEAKGMIRKAAAAAHDAAALLNLLRRRTESWKQNVKFYSLCGVYALKNLRSFLQSTVRRRLLERGSKEHRDQGTSDLSELLPAIVGSKLSASLASLLSISTHNSFLAMFGDDETEIMDVFLPLVLYKEAVVTWGECVPLVFRSANSQIEILRSLIVECSQSAGAEGVPHIRSAEALTKMPTSEMEPQVHKLQCLCKRLRVADLLDALVPSPSCYVLEMKGAQTTSNASTDLEEMKTARKRREPFRASPVVSLLASASKDVRGGKGELQRLFLALCHRFHSRVLLWGDLYATAEGDVDDGVGAAVAQSPASNGDMVRIGSTPSTTLQFDATKCSDSIAILGDSSSGANGSSVHQRASKVWGTVLSTQCYSPKTGVHRWAVRLDKCERGHVFVGVATAQSSMRTYVGGDKYGWGMIGTQALWHDRRKIRGDYGATFRTGSTIVVTLDTNAGTLSFSSWKDSSASSSFSLDPLLQNQSTTRRQGHTGGTVDDWGIAFEGLPLDSRLYPAVGLYQRDDRVTLLGVESMGSTGRDGGLSIAGGVCYYPFLDTPEDNWRTKAIAEVRRFNDTLSWEGLQYVLDTLQLIEKCLQQDSRDEPILATLFPSLAAALCLVPNSIPILSERLALNLLPHLSKFLLKLDGLRSDQKVVNRLFRTGIKPGGKWIIRATGSSGESSDFEEYFVDFSSAANEEGVNVGFEGTGVGTTGKSKNGLVAIFGTTKGSSVHFVEEWSDGSGEGFGSTSPDETSSCVVAARLSLDGTKFEGTYRNVQFGTYGQIIGILQDDQTSVSKFRLKDAPASSKQSAELADGIVIGEAVLCLAFNHMATIVGEDAAGDQLTNIVEGISEEQVAHQVSVRKLLSGKLLGGSSLASSNSVLTDQLGRLRQQYMWGNDFEDPYKCRHLDLLEAVALKKAIGDDATNLKSLSIEDIKTKVAALDESVIRESGSKGSLNALCLSNYDDARRRIVCAFVKPCHLEDAVTSGNSKELVPIWQAALKILEDGLRRAMSDPKGVQSRKAACVDRCNLFIQFSKFLATLDFSDFVTVNDTAAGLSSFYKIVQNEFDLDLLRKEMEAASRGALLRLFSLHEMTRLFSETEKSGRDDDNFVALESLVHGLPRILGRSPLDSLMRMRKPGANRSGGSRATESRALRSAGADKVTRQAIKCSTLQLFNLLGRTAGRALSRRGQFSCCDSIMSVDSLIISILTVFTMTLNGDDVYEVVQESGMIDHIKEALSQHAGAMSVEKSLNSDEQLSVVNKLQEICQREVSRSVLGASVAAVHAVIFQTLHRLSGKAGDEKKKAEGEKYTRVACYDLLFGEMEKAINCAAKMVAESSLLVVARRKGDDWEKWCQASCSISQSQNGEKRSNTRQIGSAGLLYLQENGTSQLSQTSSPQKVSSRQKNSPGSNSKNALDSIVKLQNGFAFQLLSQWLHILCGVLSVPTALSLLSNNQKWITLLLGAAGLSVDKSTDGLFDKISIKKPTLGLLPARFRSRILRFLLPFLDGMEPNDKVIVGLVKLAGVAALPNSTGLDEDAKFVSREAVTLLRRLHSPARAEWRESVNRTISSEIIDSSEQLAFHLGVLAFLSGSLESIGRGSYVLLKPAAAAPLSVDQQSSPSSKGHASGVGGSGSGIGATPHHIVGNGTEGVVAGLCRHDASAGLVSNIDMKNGICEVVLLTRDQVDPDESPDSLLLSKALNGPTSSSRQSLTVRALRTALSDVAHAQEAPLFLDESMTFEKLLGSSVEPALQTLFFVMGRDASLTGLRSHKAANEVAADSGKDDHLTGLNAGLVSISSAIMMLRSAVVVLSDKRITSAFLQNGSSKNILSTILQLALPTEIDSLELSDAAEKAQKCFLSSLPVHEARYGYLVSMVKDLSARNETLAAVSEEEWATRLEELKTRQQYSRDEGKKDIASTTAITEVPPTAAESGRSETAGVASSAAGSNAGAASNSRSAEASSNRAVSQSTAGSNSDDEDDEENEAEATAAAHLREAAIAQMAELGLPRSWSEFALRRTGGDIEAAVHFLLENGGEMERLLADERERDRLMQRQGGGGQAARRRGQRAETGSSNHLLRQLQEMGFPSRWCAEALAATGNNVDEALTWILTHGERLSEEDEAMEDEIDDEVDDEDEDESMEEDDDDDDDNENDRAALVSGADASSKVVATLKTDTDGETVNNAEESTKSAWSGSVVPLRFISGRSIIDSKTLAISGLPTGGFSSVGTKGILLCSGKWYYEAILDTAGCLQIGWADGSFAGHCHADRGDGTGDGPSSWAFDGWRRYRWHSTATEWGCRWQEGDVIGCLVDMDERKVSFTLNGKGEEIGMGEAFSGEGFRPCGGVYACVSFNRREKLRLQLSEPFTHQPPPGYRGVGTAVLEAVKEREMLAKKEVVLDRTAGLKQPEPRRFLCDFSDGEHGHELSAWAHRYYGSDASVHLGSGRSKQSAGALKSSAASITDSPAAVCLTHRVEKAWANSKVEVMDDSNAKTSESLAQDKVVSKMQKGYIETSKQLDRQLVNESAILGVLFARKLILHLVVAMGEDFNLNCLLPDGAEAKTNARRFWGVIETCASLRCAGWVGEAGAMAIAAEALGLGISSNDHGHSRQSSLERAGMASIADLDEGVYLPTGGITQLLSSVMRSSVETNATETGSLLAACAETAIGSDGGGGVLVFLQQGLQNAVCSSQELQCVLAAAVRRSIRLLAVVEYEGDDSDSVEQTEDDAAAAAAAESDKTPPLTEKKGNDEESDNPDRTMLPDARLISFLTGLLMSKPVEDSVSKEDYLAMLQDLFQAWSIGMLSASLPWRMVCAFTVAGILNKCPEALLEAVSLFPTLARFYGRLESTVSRRVWAERAAVPVCSRYAQAMLELLAGVKIAVAGVEMPTEFLKFWGKISVDAATPLPTGIPRTPALTSESHWESDDGWVSSDSSWELWTGTVEYLAVDWETPSRSPVRSLMDGGEGPPMLREGCFVMRGSDWSKKGSCTKAGDGNGDDDGRKSYEAEKAKREKEKRRAEDEAKEEEAKESDEGDPASPTEEDSKDEFDSVAASDPTAEPTLDDPAAVSAVDATNPEVTAIATTMTATNDEPDEDTTSTKKQKKKKLPSPKLAVGIVLSVEPWNGQPGLGRKVCWHLTKKEGVYRYGGDGGLYDISHVEVNDKHTRVKKRHPIPESAEQCSSRHGFGANKKYNVVLRLQRIGRKMATDSEERSGVLEWPDFGAGVRADCVLNSDGSVAVTEKHLLYGSKDSGWEARFGQPSFVSGSTFTLTPSKAPSLAKEEANTKSPFLSFYEELVGKMTHKVVSLRDNAGGSLSVTSEMRMLRGAQKYVSKIEPVQAPTPPPIHFDRDYHASSLSLSRDGRTVSCVASDGRGAAYASVGFTKGVHYWEVKLEQADIGSVFIGVAEKQSSSGSGGAYDTPPRLNRWPGWGFVNFRATYSSGAERVYGAHCHAGDTVGVLLDCDAGRVSFFFDGLKYGEHILNDLGCAFENLSPFGFNVDGCGSGGAGQGAPSGIEGGRGGRYPAQGLVRPRALWPVIGLRNQGDRVTLSPKWSTSYGVDGVTATRNVLAVDEILCCFAKSGNITASKSGAKQLLPEWFVSEAFTEYQRWHSCKWKRAVTRGSGPYKQTSFGLDVDLDASPLACATACAILGLKHALLVGDRVRLLRSAGRILELAEEAIILGAHQGRLYYQIVSQKSEGGSLMEGGGRAWFLDESEVVDDLPFVGKGKAKDIDLPLMDRFKCRSPGGLKIAYDGGAVVRSDLEIIDGSMNLGVIPVNTVIPKEDVIQRRVNSCGVTRYRVRAEVDEEIKEGWISARIRGGKEEAIVEHVQSDKKEDTSKEVVKEDLATKAFPTALSCALVWYKEFEKITGNGVVHTDLAVANIASFEASLEKGFFEGMSINDSDALLAASIGAISNFSDTGDSVDCGFDEIFSALEFALSAKKGTGDSSTASYNPASNQAAAYMLASVKLSMPPIASIMARAALLRAFNRRARRALPWMSVRPCQEGSAIFGGLCGHGASTERSGRTHLLESQELWVQIPSIASRIRSHRRLFFCSVKVGLLQSITEATATPTPLSHDEYELPREIRTVRINRLRSRMAMAGIDNGAKRKYSVFAQLHNETKGWGGAALRRGYVAKGHGGQRRAFKVKLIGEGVNDYSGPYREAFTDVFSEVLNIDPASSRGALGVLDPTPNKSADLGENRELCMFSLNGRDLSGLKKLLGKKISKEESRIWRSFSSLTAPRDELSREVEEALVFLGRLTGTAYRHGIPVDLPLPLQAVWKPIVEEDSKDEDRLRELDELAFRQSSSEPFSPLLWWQQKMLNSFVEGLSNVLPVEILSLLDGAELRGLMCGNEDVDVDLLKSVVEYEGYVETDEVIQCFWETLRDLSNEERKLFLQFVWARNRLPLKKSDFEAPFKIQRDSANTGERADQALPSASTCFFSLALPDYTGKEILKEKLLFAIKNVTTMETDFQTNSAEIAEGYRAF